VTGVFSWNLFTDIQDMWSYPGQVNAFRAGTVVAVLAALIGWFMVLRQQSFAGHTLAVVGFPGAAAAVLAGLSLTYGYFTFCLAAALIIAALPRRGRHGHAEQSAVIGTLQAFALAAGMLFVALYGGFLNGTNALLFGSVLGITTGQVTILAAVAALALLASTPGIDARHLYVIGHSQGGMQAVKVLYELAGQLDDSVRVYDPMRGSFEDRTTIVDPLTHKTRPVVGVSMSYASAVGAGGATFLMPNQWMMVDKLQTIPNTVDEFTGFAIPIDVLGGDSHYTHNGTANVRNVDLPVTYSHVFVPAAGKLPENPEVRDWINDYVPSGKHDTSSLPVEAAQHVLWAADVWYSVKKHWCLEAQRLIRAERSREVPSQSASGPAPALASDPPSALPAQLREAESAAGVRR